MGDWVRCGGDFNLCRYPGRFRVEGVSKTSVYRPDGEGGNAVWLAEQSYRVTATEISSVALEKAVRLARVRHAEVNFVHADMLAWDWLKAALDTVIGVFIQFVGPEERQTLSASWGIFELKEYEESIAESVGRCGQSALIDLVARRH